MYFLETIKLKNKIGGLIMNIEKSEMEFLVHQEEAQTIFASALINMENDPQTYRVSFRKRIPLENEWLIESVVPVQEMEAPSIETIYSYQEEITQHFQDHHVRYFKRS